MAQQNVADLPTEEQTGEFDELQPGTKLLNGQYTITRFLNNGGFGITYLAKDSLNRNVVIKECFLSSFCRRSKNVVIARSRAHQAELRSVVQLFIREAHNLAKLVHPNIVAVHQVFEDNGTAYMAIDYIEGRDLLEAIEDGSAKFAPEEIVRITEKLLSAVKFIHENGMLHRDISPDNVLISRTGEPILIDFGAARDQVAQKGRTMTAMRVVKDGYSPQEFYIQGSEQGPFSDLYALGATLYHLIAGEAPAHGQVRLAEIAEGRGDSYQPLAGRYTGYPKGFLEAIDKAMMSLPKERVQSANEWLAFFRTPGVLPIYPERHRAAVPVQAEAAPVAKAAPVVAASPVASSGRKGSGALLGALVAAAALGVGFVLLSVGEEAAVEEAVVEEAAVEEAAVGVAVEAAAVVTAPVVEADAVAEVEAVAAAEAVAEVAPVAEPVAEPAVAAAPAEPLIVPVAAEQVAFAAWDVRMPFAEAVRIVDGKPSIIVSRINPTADLAMAGNWLEPGITITAINDAPVEPGMTIAAVVLGQLSVDPDGYARSVVSYLDKSGQPQTGLLATQAVRLVALTNGVSFIAEHLDGQWTTRVQAVAEGSATTLQEGDVIFREKFTGVAMDGPQSLEGVLPALIERKVGTVDLSVVRDRSVETAFMQLTIEP